MEQEGCPVWARMFPGCRSDVLWLAARCRSQLQYSSWLLINNQARWWLDDDVGCVVVDGSLRVIAGSMGSFGVVIFVLQDDIMLSCNDHHP